MVIFDANMILRRLLKDNQEMADKAEQYLAAGDAAVTVEVVAEVVYVLKGVYSLERDVIAAAVKDFLKRVASRDADVLDVALDVYAAHNLDFVDCVLYSRHVVDGDEIATFDKRLLKLISTYDT